MGGFAELITPLVGLGRDYLTLESQSDVIAARAAAEASAARAQIAANAENSKLIMYGIIGIVAILLITKKR